MEKREKSSGDSKTIALIGCSKSKIHYPCKAGAMYLGTLFKKSVVYCRLKKIDFYILSAKYGLIHPDQIINPYDETLNKMNKNQRAVWAKKINNQIVEQQLQNYHKIIMAGSKYSEFIDGQKPFEGLSIGRILQKLNYEIGSMKGKLF